MVDSFVSQLGAAKTALPRSDNVVMVRVDKPESLMRMIEVSRRTGLSRATIYRLIAAGDFPRQVKLSQRASAWSSRAVSAWIADRLSSAS